MIACCSLQAMKIVGKRKLQKMHSLPSAFPLLGREGGEGGGGRGKVELKVCLCC